MTSVVTGVVLRSVYRKVIGAAPIGIDSQQPITNANNRSYVCFATHSKMAKMTIGIAAIAM
jgi:hypothetical protein